MENNIKPKQELLAEEQRERHFTELFNRCIRIMDACYRKASMSTALIFNNYN